MKTHQCFFILYLKNNYLQSHTCVKSVEFPKTYRCNGNDKFKFFLGVPKNLLDNLWSFRVYTKIT
jgi:hypothetical protein